MADTKSERTRELLVAEALRQFLMSGYENVSLHQISEATNLSKGALTYHFDSKKVLFQAAVEYFFDTLETKRTLPESAELPPLRTYLEMSFRGIPQISELLASIFGIHDTSMNYHRLLLDVIQVLGDYELLHRYFSPALQSLHTMISRAREDGQIREDIDVSSLAHQILATIEGSYVIQFYIKSDDFERTAASMVENLWRGLRS